MTKTKKIDVITVRLTCHIPVDRDDRRSTSMAYDLAEGLIADAAKLGQIIREDLRLNRVPAPEPAPEATEPEPEPIPDSSDDGLDFPSGLDRRAETGLSAA